MWDKELTDLAEKNTESFDDDSLSEQLERESRRYSRRLEEEDEARLR